VRLHRLEVEGFGPFGGREEVDFDALSASGLFLLSGPTGAGKTSVLDAVCFALFGAVPGVRGENRLGSDHRAPGVTPRVVLEATVGGRRLRVTRTPKHERPPMRGGGAPVQEGASAKLELADADGSWTAVAAKIPEVAHELDPLLGMSAEQFLQVVMLPQGAFATFLRADAKARQQVLERLFDAGRFSKIEFWLQDRAKEARTAVQGARVSADHALASAAGAWQADGEIPRLGGDPAATVDDLRAWIAAEAARTATAAAEAEASRARADATSSAAEAAATAARALAERQDRRRKAEADLRKVEEHRAGRDKLATELDAHRAAAPLVPYLNADRAASAAAENAATELRKARAYVEQLEDPELLADPGRWSAVSRARGEQAAGLEDLRQAEVDLPGRDRELARLEAAVADHARRGEEAAAQVAAGEQQLQAATAEREERVRRSGASHALEQDLARADAALAAGVRRDELAGRLATARDAVRAATDAHQSARDRSQDLTGRRLDGYAAELAATLEDGEPCAVCGSTSHPAPAHSDVPPVTAEDVERAAAEERTAATAREAAERSAGTVDRELAGATAAAGASSAGDLRAAREAAAARLATARAEAAELERLTARIAELTRAIETARQAVSAAATGHATATTTLASARTDLEATRARIAAACGGAGTVAAMIYRLRDVEQRLDGAANALAKDASARGAAEEAADGLRTALAASRFAVAEDAVAAVLMPARATEVERQVQAFDASEAGARAVLSQEEIATVALEPVADVDGTTAALVAARDAASAATSEASAAAACVRALEDRRADLLASLDALGPLADAADRAHALSELARGGAGNRRKIQLSSWVLAARLEQVAAAATVHLLRMSAGRYALVLHEEPASGRGKGNAGLGLRVRDGWTGEERDTSTLSGGESFFASLSLALGLAETVSAEAGGLDLGTLFIDEGFGTLDEQTLDEVLGVLDALRDGGRAVGIVSHVHELKQRVPMQLTVQKAREGSRLTQGTAAVDG
jgi:DNA repair protein SbcC/Rad50